MFVDPPEAMPTMIAFRNVSLVIRRDGVLFSRTISTMARPASLADLVFSWSFPGTMELPGSTRFRVSPKSCMVQAVPIVAHAPNEGHAQVSIASISDASAANLATSTSQASNFLPL